MIGPSIPLVRLCIVRDLPSPSVVIGAENASLGRANFYDSRAEKA
jgi:hypothetical protein